MASYLKSHGLYPHTEPEDAAALQASKPDFIGINYYFSLCVKAKTGPINYDQPPFWVSDAFDICENPHLETTEWMDKGIDPAGLHIGMRKVYNRYRLPMIVTENGMAYSEAPGPDGKIHDVYRIDYLRRHIQQLEIMLEEGLPVFGYCDGCPPDRRREQHGPVAGSADRQRSGPGRPCDCQAQEAAEINRK